MLCHALWFVDVDDVCLVLLCSQVVPQASVGGGTRARLHTALALNNVQQFSIAATA
jgi:hypothetical protein